MSQFSLEIFEKALSNFFWVSSIDKLKLLDNFHIWESSYLVDRFNFRPKNPLKCYLLDVFKVKLAKKIEYNVEEAKGCTSWFQLKNEVAVRSYEKVNDDFQNNKVLKVLNELV